jgi:hypothetical protein
MVGGFNHNVRYQGVVYHIQTEDSGLKNPAIVTLLYHGGTIVASRKTSYADIAKIDHLEQVVEDLMKEQHRNMLRSLKAGEFDEMIRRLGLPAQPAPASAKEKVSEVPGHSGGTQRTPKGPDAAGAVDVTLDDAILSYLFDSKRSQ